MRCQGSLRSLLGEVATPTFLMVATPIPHMDSPTRFYAAAIASVSGLYSLWHATTGSSLGIAAWAMIGIGIVVLLHGTALITGSAQRLGSTSGPLMIGYATVMLLIQALLAGDVLGGDQEMTGGMGGGMNGGMGEMAGGMGWDPGMVALAVLMLLSGIIMARTDAMGEMTDGSQ